MKKILYFLFLFQLSNISAQEGAFVNDVNTVNGLIHYKNKPFTGTLYSDEEIQNECFCILKASYSNGKLNGAKQEWYKTGVKRNKKNYINGKKNGIHTSWNQNGKKNLEEVYIKGSLAERKQYFISGNMEVNEKYNPLNFSEKIYEKRMFENNKIQDEKYFKQNQLLELKKYFPSGDLKYHIKHNSENLSEKIYEKVLFKNGIVKSETHFKNNRKSGNFLESFENGKTHKKITYSNGNEVEKKIYSKSGFLKESLQFSDNLNLFESINYYDDKKIKSKGYFSKKSKKDGVWITYDNQGNKVTEKTYSLGRIIKEGKYNNNLKEGVWKFYMKDGVTQKNIIYVSGNEIETKVFNVNHLYYNNYKNTDDVALFEFVKLDGSKENIAITSDVPFTKNPNYQYILGTIANTFLKRMKMLSKDSISENTVISKKIHITNLNVKYTSTNIQGHISKEFFTTYDAYISLNLKLTNVGGKTLFTKAYKFNKSGKLLNSLLNTAVQTYSRTKKDAFVSALKSIKLKKILKKHFSIKK